MLDLSLLVNDSNVSPSCCSVLFLCLTSMTSWGLAWSTAQMWAHSNPCCCLPDQVCVFLKRWCGQVCSCVDTSNSVYWFSSMTPWVGPAENESRKVVHVELGSRRFKEWGHPSSDSHPCSRWQAAPPAALLFMFLTVSNKINHSLICSLFLLSLSLSHTDNQVAEVGDVITVSRRPVIEPTGLWLQ